MWKSMIVELDQMEQMDCEVKRKRMNQQAYQLCLNVSKATYFFYNPMSLYELSDIKGKTHRKECCGEIWI